MWVRRVGDRRRRAGRVVATVNGAAVVAWGGEAAMPTPACELVPYGELSPMPERERRYWLAFAERFGAVS